MKHITWMVPLGLLALAGCDGMLDESPESFLAPENFYQTGADLEAAVFAAYPPLIGGLDNLGKNLWLTLDGASDEGISNPIVPSAAVQAFGQMDFAPDQVRINANWAQFYLTITRANIVIERASAVQATPERKAAIVGEAQFLRALAYYYLVRLYGDVPLVLTQADALQQQIARAPKEEVYAQIVLDAEAAALALPTVWDATNVGRATRGSALTLLADVHLTRQEWQRAAERAKQVIDLGVHSLHPDFQRNFVPQYENGPEDVFSLQAAGEPGGPNSSFVDFYYPRAVTRGSGGGNGWLIANPWQVNSFIEGDYRKEVTYETVFQNTTTGQWVTTPQVHTYKFRPARIASINEGDLNIPIYRYAEVLLFYAEALNELGRGGEAVQHLNQVRARARQGTGSENRAEPADYSGSTDQSVLREVIFQERRWELAHEGKRWFDLIRRGESYFMSELQAHDPQANPAPHKMLMPIPQSEIEGNPALVQNPGY